MAPHREEDARERSPDEPLGAHGGVRDGAPLRLSTHKKQQKQKIKNKGKPDFLFALLEAANFFMSNLK